LIVIFAAQDTPLLIAEKCYRDRTASRTDKNLSPPRCLQVSFHHKPRAITSLPGRYDFVSAAMFTERIRKNAPRLNTEPKRQKESCPSCSITVIQIQKIPDDFLSFALSF